ncbi:hypothetical protein GF337_15545 [candidate division KSB1 bacterium]|nr:hypothetical protein [candidate division KSB1 bacterium]
MSLSVPRANVYDIRSLKKMPNFKYFLDTNILKFVFAKTIANTSTYQDKYYPEFFKSLLSNKFICFTYTQNLLELFSVIDKAEAEIENVNIKNYRFLNLEKYLSDREIIFEELDNSINIFSSEITTDHLKSYFQIDCSIDLNDFIYIQLANETDVGFVTDDAEFIYMDRINVFTANMNAIDKANRFKRLKT